MGTSITTSYPAIGRGDDGEVTYGRQPCLDAYLYTTACLFARDDQHHTVQLEMMVDASAVHYRNVVGAVQGLHVMWQEPDVVQRFLKRLDFASPLQLVTTESMPDVGQTRLLCGRRARDRSAIQRLFEPFQLSRFSSYILNERGPVDQCFDVEVSSYGTSCL